MELKWQEIQPEERISQPEGKYRNIEGKILSIDWASMLGKRYAYKGHILEVSGIEEDLKVWLIKDDKRSTYLFEVVYDNVYNMPREMLDLIQSLLD